MKKRTKAYLVAALLWFRAHFARSRNGHRQRVQTHLHQKHKGIRPPNVVAYLTMIFKRIHNIS